MRDQYRIDFTEPRVIRSFRCSTAVIENARLFPIQDSAVFAVSGQNTTDQIEPGEVVVYHRDKTLRFLGREPESENEQRFDRFRFGVHEAKRATDRIPANYKKFKIRRLDDVEESVQRMLYFALTTGDPRHGPTLAVIAATAASRLGDSSYLRNEHIIKAQQSLRDTQRIISGLRHHDMGNRLPIKHEQVLHALEMRWEEMSRIGVALNPRSVRLAAAIDGIVRVAEQHGRIAQAALTTDPPLRDRMRSLRNDWLKASEFLSDCMLQPYVRVISQMSTAFLDAYIWSEPNHGSETDVRNALLTVVSLSRLPRTRRKLALMLEPVALTRVCDIPIDWHEAIDEALSIRATLLMEAHTLNTAHASESAGLMTDAIAALTAHDAHSAYTLLVAAGDKMDGITRPTRRR